MPAARTFSRRPLAVAVTVAFVTVAVGAGIFTLRTSRAQQPAQPQAVPVMVASVVESEVSTLDEFSGRLEAVERVDVRSRVAGAVQSIHFQEGAMVRAGELLVTIDPAPYAADVERARAQVGAAQARLAQASGDYERAQRLWEESAIAKRELDERGNARREAEANVAATQAALQSANLNLSYTQVRAPVSGRVGKADVTVGNLVAAGPGAPVLTTLVSVSPIYASFDADEAVVARALAELGAAASSRTRLQSIPVLMTTSIEREIPRKGYLQLVDNQVNARSGTVRVRAVFDNADGSLIPGQFADIRMGRAKPTPALLINERAVGTDQNKKFVLVVGEDSKATYREVALGPAVEGLRIVTSGLKPGEQIVVNGLQRVRPGSPVVPQPVTMASITNRSGS